MAIPPRLPTVVQVLEIAKSFGMTLTEEDAASFRGLMAGSMASYARLDELVEPKLPVKYPREPGYRPPAEENPYNAWYWKTHIVGAKSGILAGERVAVKDNICVAGVPMMNGSRVLEGYVPEVHATVVTRILDAGGVIAGKAACEDLCFSAGSHTCATGPIRNPHNPKHSTGGSSGGSAALVAAGEVTMALGGDQWGSIRTPSAWCGVFGLKPTWGLVPMTGGMPISYLDPFTGCAARSVRRRRPQHAAEHLPLGCERSSGLHRPLRKGRRLAGRHHAGRTALRGDDRDPGGAGARAGRRLAHPLNELHLIPAACRLT
jgi:amidase